MTTVFDLLSRPAIAERFGIALDDLPRLQSLVAQAGVRWGLDAAHRSSLGQPADDTFCWYFGLCRLLLGYAVGDATDATLGGIAPVEHVDTDDADSIGKLAEFIARLGDLAQAVRSPHPITEWVDVLTRTQNAFFGAESGARRFADALSPLLSDWRAVGERQATVGAIALDEVRYFMEQSLTLAAGSMSAARGGVVVAQLGSTLGIPARVTCI